MSEDELLAFASGELDDEQRRQAERHLDRCEECQALLNEAVRAMDVARTARLDDHGEVSWSTSFRPGAVVGQRYVIRRFIARGGMGEVYEAFDQELQERVALKTVTATASDDPSAVRRLKAEVQLARRVSHPNVCRIYDFGSHRGPSSPPISFLTMEFVEGDTLGEHLRRHGPLTPDEALPIARALLAGLAAAHAAGVLHRDFKSDNVVLRRSADGIEPLILDFGLARALDHMGQSSHSGRGLVGTLAYMAPEQLEGHPSTTASDVYSFGLVWFEMLTGELPFQARSSPAMTTLERLTKPVPPPSSRHPRVPKELDAVVLACLRRSARERLPTAPAVLARLQALDSAAAPKRPYATVLLSTGLGLVTVASALWFANLHVPLATPASAVAAHMSRTPSLRPTITSSAVPPPPTRPVAPAAGSIKPGVLPGPTPAKPPKASPAAVKGLSSAPGQAQVVSTRAPRLEWENPFSAPPAASADPSAMLDQHAQGRAPAGDSQLSKRPGELVGDRPR